MSGKLKASDPLLHFLEGNADIGMNRNRVIETFQHYVSAYNPSDPKIRLKIDHTYRVAGLCGKIAASVGADADLAWLCGMLHDIGRFEQV